jgi:uncharacterized caspase-like protein
VRVVVRNSVGETAAERLLIYRGVVQAPKRRLFLVAIGVNDYPKASKELKKLDYSSADAAAFAQTLVKGAATLYDEVMPPVLLSSVGAGSKPPTRAQIEDALSIFKMAGPDDTSVLFLAGHGVNDGSNYLFLPQDAEKESSGWRASTVVPWMTLQKALESTNGTRVMFVDTCHSGGAYNARVTKDAYDKGIIAFAATDANTLAYEQLDLKHGVFTWAVVQGMLKEAVDPQDGSVTALSLGTFVGRKVPNLTQKKQIPTFAFPPGKDITLVKHNSQ